ncbi:tyrosinase-like [Sycon ciliatum]|uniref:tyrosinase-like n=1 Tax=Sycon ciliatum TaxID=27933 RepID=UPI0031F62602
MQSPVEIVPLPASENVPRRRLLLHYLPWLVALCLQSGAFGQFPLACINNDDLRNQKCCPSVPVGGSNMECGGPGRGACVRITDSHCHVETSDEPADVLAYLKNPVSEPSRYPWPNRVFTQICECEGNWAGYDCTECKFGYVKTADESVCVKRKTPLVRRNYLTLNGDERNYFKQVLAGSSSRLSSPSRFGVLISEENFSKSPRTTSNLSQADFKRDLSVYEFMIWLHYYAAKDTGAPTATENSSLYNVSVDFAHFGPALLTWHRYYQLLLESELQRLSGNSSFTVPYWDWLDHQSRDCLFDEFDIFDGNRTNIGGAFDSFRITCFNSVYAEPTTEPNVLLRLPRRGPGSLCPEAHFYNEAARVFRNYGPNARRCQWLPSERDLWDILSRITVYDIAPFNLRVRDPSSLRAAIEGTVPFPGKSYCATKTPRAGLLPEMHSLVHVYVGGSMANDLISPSDPIFFLHHAMTDRVFERLMVRLRELGNLHFRPEHGASPGHNSNDCMIPFFPLQRNKDMMKLSEDFGYAYDSLPSLKTKPGRAAKEWDQCAPHNPTVIYHPLPTAESSPAVTSVNATSPHLHHSLYQRITAMLSSLVTYLQTLL